MFRQLLTALIIFAATTATHANVTLTAVDSGWYRDGFHITSNENYIVGSIGGRTYHNFFVFDLEPQTYTDAKLRLYNPTNGTFTADAYETLVLHEVTTSISDLVSSTSSVAIFNDLGSGVVYGSEVIGATDVGTYIDFDLNPTALAAINSTSGLFALGGRLAEEDANDRIFRFTHNTVERNPPQLVLTNAAAVPEPTSIVIFSVLIASFAGRRMWRRK